MVLNTAIPTVLLVLFVLAISFPDRIPFASTGTRSWEGLGTTTFTLGEDLSFSLKTVPSGECPGGTLDIEKAVRVERGFLLGETEVTSALFQAVVDLAPEWKLSGKAVQTRSGDYPADYISWYDAIVWCNALSSALGERPVYYMDKGFTVPCASAGELEKTLAEVYADGDSNGFRLARADEWELAARYIDGASWTSGTNPSGGTHPYFEQARSDELAVYNNPEPEKVKSRFSNRLGLYDMSGNVWEWCFEKIDEGHERITRGGSWMSTGWRLQIGGTFGTPPEYSERGQGMRIAKNAP